MGTLLQEVMSLLHPHYVVSLLLAVCFFIMKTTSPICYALFDDCELELVSKMLNPILSPTLEE